MQPDDPRHGTIGGYTNHRCRCEACTTAWRIGHADYLRRHPEQREKANVRNRARYASMTPEQRAKENERNRRRWTRQTPEQRERKAAYDRARRARLNTSKPAT